MKTPKKAYLRLDRKHPQVEIRYLDHPSQYFTLQTLLSAKPKDVLAAEQVLNSINRKIALKLFNSDEYITPESAKTTWQDAAGKYLEQRHNRIAHADRNKRLSLQTVETDGYALQLFAKIMLFNQKPFSQLNFKIVETFVEKLQENGYKPNSIRTYLKHLSSFVSWCVRENLTRENPFKQIEKPVGDPVDRYLQKEIIEQFVDWTRQQKQLWPYQATILTLNTGIRRESILTANKKNIEIENIDGKEAWFLSTIEKGRKERSIYLIPRALEIVDKRLEILSDDAEIEKVLSRCASPAHIDRYRERAEQGFLFFEILNINTISKIYTKAKHKIGIPGTWHALRHSAATYMLESGMDLDIIKDVLGHTDIITTKIYAKATKTKIAREFRKFPGY